MISEIIRSGLNSIDKGQMEAARSSGLNYVSSIEIYYSATSIAKNGSTYCQSIYFLIERYLSSCRYRITRTTHHAQIFYAQNGSGVIPIFVTIALMYFIVNFTLSLVARRLELKQA